MNVQLEIGRDGFDEDVKVVSCPFCQEKLGQDNIFFLDYTTHPIINCEKCEGAGFLDASMDDTIKDITTRYRCIRKGTIKEENPEIPNHLIYWDVYEVPLIKVVKVALPELQTYSQSGFLTDEEIWAFQNAETEEKREELARSYRLTKVIDYYPSCDTMEKFEKLYIPTVSISPTYNLGYFEGLKGDGQIIYVTENNSIIRSWAD